MNIKEYLKIERKIEKMNIKKLLEMQKELDTEILERSCINEYPFKNIKIALLVELGELANEWQGFKHWKKSKVINREKLLEEWSDCFHFALSLENELKQTSEYMIQNIDEIVKVLDNCDKLDRDIIEAFEISYECIVAEENILTTIIALGRCLDISLDEMEEAYLSKNKVNHDRQAAGY